MDDHTLQQVIDLAVKTAVLKAKKEAILECRPVGSYFLTETEDDPNILFGGRWQKLTGRYVLQCSDDTHAAGTTVEAGLPNIAGDTGSLNWSDNDNNALDYDTWLNHNGPYERRLFATNGEHIVPIYTQEPGLRRVGVNFDASRANPIYGRSDTVQPPARIVNVWKRVS